MEKEKKCLGLLSLFLAVIGLEVVLGKVLKEEGT